MLIYPIPTHVQVLGYYKFKCFVHPASLFCVSHSNDIRIMHAVSTTQIADILYFNLYLSESIVNNMSVGIFFIKVCV